MRTLNQRVVGSSPTAPTKENKRLGKIRPASFPRGLHFAAIHLFDGCASCPFLTSILLHHLYRPLARDRANGLPIEAELMQYCGCRIAASVNCHAFAARRHKGIVHPVAQSARGWCFVAPQPCQDSHMGMIVQLGCQRLGQGHALRHGKAIASLELVNGNEAVAAYVPAAHLSDVLAPLAGPKEHFESRSFPACQWPMGAELVDLPV